jgi:RNA polymerase sigma factor (sigma-70 family)
VCPFVLPQGVYGRGGPGDCCRSEGPGAIREAPRPVHLAWDNRRPWTGPGVRTEPVSELSDEVLLAGMAVGDETAAITFVRRYQRRVYGLALSMLGDPQAAEDVAQEALVRAWRHAQVFDARRASAATWVLAITRNLAIDAMRVRRSTPVDPARFLTLGTVSQDTSPEEAAEALDHAPEIRDALGKLPAEQRRALVLAVVYGLTAADVSERESIPLGTAKTRIRTGLQKLRRTLDLQASVA